MSFRKSLALAALALLGCQPARPATTAWKPRSAPPLQRYLDLPRATAPSLSRDGRRLAFLSDAPGLPQPFSVPAPLAQGDPSGQPPAAPSAFTRIASVPERVQLVQLLGDGRRALLGHDRGGDENTQFSLVDLASGERTALTSAPAVRHLFGALDGAGSRLVYSSNARNGRDFDLMLRPLDGDQPARLLRESSGHHELRAWSPDGRFVVGVHRRSSSDEAPFLYWLDPGDAPVPAAVAGSPPEGTDPRYRRLNGWYEPARWPDVCVVGSSVVGLTDARHEFVHLELLSPSAAGAQVLLQEPHDMELLACSPGGDRLAVAVNVEGQHQLRIYQVPAASAAFTLVATAERHTLPAGVIRALSFSQDGRELAVQLGRPTEPDHVWTIHTDTGATRQRTQPGPELDGLPARAEPTLESLRSFDGEPISLFLYRPRLAAGERAPVVVWVHGGPESQFQPAYSPVIQALVARGYAVAAPNVRGSTGYGKRFTHLDDVEKREDSVQDLAAVNRWLRARPDVLADRIAVMGGSYGGYMVLASLTLHPELWSAGVDVVGIANFRTFLEKTAPYRRSQRESEYGSLSSDGALLDRLSPLHRVDRIRAPLFVIHGANDPRVPVTEAEQIVEALRRRQHPVTYLRFDDEGHGLTRRPNQLLAYTRVLDFLDEVNGR